MGHLGQDKHTAFNARRNSAVELRDVRGGGIEVVLVFCELPTNHQRQTKQDCEQHTNLLERNARHAAASTGSHDALWIDDFRIGEVGGMEE